MCVFFMVICKNFIKIFLNSTNAKAKDIICEQFHTWHHLTSDSVHPVLKMYSYNRITLVISIDEKHQSALCGAWVGLKNLRFNMKLLCSAISSSISCALIFHGLVNELILAKMNFIQIVKRGCPIYVWALPH